MVDSTGTWGLTNFNKTGNQELPRTTPSASATFYFDYAALP